MIWTVHLEGGPRRVNHAAVLLGDKIYSFGGFCSGDNFKEAKPIVVHCLDVDTLRWKPLAPPSPRDCVMNVVPNVPYHRYGHTVVAYKDRAYLFGGRNDVDGACQKLYEFNPETRCWRQVLTSGVVPPARDGHTACIIGDSMYIFGGFEENFNRFSNETYAVDLQTGKWEEVLTKGSIPTWRDFHTAVGIGTQMWVFAGRSDVMGQFHSKHELYDDRLFVLDVKTGVWTDVAAANAPAGRRSHSSFVYNDCIYVFGGFNGLFNEHYNDLHRFDLKRNEWCQMAMSGAGPKPRRRQCCVIVDSKCYLFGGTSPRDSQSQPPAQNPSAMQIDEFDEPELSDHSDLFVLDFAPSLKTLCILAVQHFCKDGDITPLLEQLPWNLRQEIIAMTRDNKISNALVRAENSSG